MDRAYRVRTRLNPGRGRVFYAANHRGALDDYFGGTGAEVLDFHNLDDGQITYTVSLPSDDGGREVLAADVWRSPDDC